MVRRTFCTLPLVFVALTASAQAKNDVGFSIGALLPPSPGVATTVVLPQATDISFGSGLTFEANYARRVLTRSSLALEIEVPLLAVPSENIQSRSASNVPRNFASLFITPSLRARLWPQRRLSPWASLGGGYARYAESASLQDGTQNPYPRGTNSGALQYGVGADYRLGKIFLPISLRGEVRNLYAGEPSLNIRDVGHNHPFVTGGFVIHF